MPAQPTGRYGLLRIPAPGVNKVEMRFAPLTQRDKFAPDGWPVRALAGAQPANPGWWEIDIDALGLDDGAYEYEFIVDGRAGGYADLTNSVDYATSHDVADAERMMNYLLGSILRAQGLGPGDLADVREALETAELHRSQQSGQRTGAVSFALYRIFGVFALLLTSLGIPMFLAGEEFGDVHDLDFQSDQPKQRRRKRCHCQRISA